jgi:hypothetical protein
MNRGRPTTTRRGRSAGGSEIRAWVSADEKVRIMLLAKAAGLTLPEYVRRRALEEVSHDRP